MLKVDTADWLEEYFKDIRNEIKKDIFSVCFSESPFNEVLWLKYAEQHKGFVIEYDLIDRDKLLCGKQEKCKKCKLNMIRSPIYPIYYSDNMYGATKFAQFYASCKMIEKSLDQEMYNKVQSVFGNQVWESSMGT